MPTTFVMQFGAGRLDPVMNPEDALASIVRFSVVASATYAAGTVVGEVTATPGTVKAYASGNADGSQNPIGILQYPVTTDSSGNITNVSEWGINANDNTVPVYTQGMYRTQDLTGLDANAVTKLSGHLVEGTVSSGLVTF